MKKPVTHPNQLELLPYCPAQITPQGAGAFLVSPGKPVFKLTVRDFARAIGVSRSSIYRRIDDGSIPVELIEAAGPRKLLIKSEAVDHFKALWHSRRF